MRKTCLDQVYELAKKDKRVFFVGSDLGFGTLQDFKDNIPERYFMEGVAEQNLVGLSAGLAFEGKIVYANTIATFITRRCFEQNVLDLGLHNLNVRLIGNGGGYVYAPLGPTHEATDDIAIMRTIPNMTIVAPADADEMKRFMPLTLEHKGPIYIRLGKGHDPIVSSNKFKFEIGKAYPYKKGTDAVVITTGITLKLGLESAERLKEEGLSVGVLHMPTIKPLDKKTLLEEIKDVPIVVSVEEHTILGGLGSAIAEVISEENFQSQKRFKRIGIPDVFAHNYGSQNELMAHYGISVEGITNTVKELRSKHI